VSFTPGAFRSTLILATARYNLTMRVMALQSGSNGNSIYVEAAGVRLLVDAGITGVQMQRRLAACGIDARDIDGLLISHDHSDHVRCMGIYHRKYGIPVYVTRQTLMTARRRTRLGVIDDIRGFSPGAALEFGPVKVQTIPTPHDSTDSVAFVFDDGERRLGVFTDLGHAFGGLQDTLCSLDAVLLESNYDPDMLQTGPYPEFLKQRIQGPGGHLSNYEAAALLRLAFCSRLKWACLAHLSEQNNEPDLALATHRVAVGDQRMLMVASRYAASPLLEV
jgi:phosphoribosyl 1,2-cyclic phosphodiesterase